MTNRFAGLKGLMSFAALAIFVAGNNLAFAQSESNWDSLDQDTLNSMAKVVLNQSQTLSFSNNLEYCGFIAFDDTGTLRATKPLAGEKESCAPDAPQSWELVASYHTHGAADVNDPEASFEMPSYDDVLSDYEEGTDGYVATPGGRFWFIDGIEAVAYLVGGPGTLRSDPNYKDFEPCEVEAISLDQIEDMDNGALDPCDL